MALTRRLVPDVLRSINSSTFIGSFQKVGSALANPAVNVVFLNTSTVTVTVSVDGMNACYIFPPNNSYYSLDATTNSPRPESEAIFIPAGTQYYAEGSAGTGFFYIFVNYVFNSEYIQF